MSCGDGRQTCIKNSVLAMCEININMPVEMSVGHLEKPSL